MIGCDTWHGWRRALGCAAIVVCATCWQGAAADDTNALSASGLAVTTNTAAASATNAIPESAASDNPPCRALGFAVGEEIFYNIYWGVIPVGQARITTAWIEENGRRLLAIRYRTRTNRVVAKLYPVNDRIEAIIEPTTFLPVRFEKDLKEGRHRIHEVTTFDYQKLKGHWTSLTKDKTKAFDIEPDTRDIVTFMYYMRSQEFRVGEQSHYRVMSDEKLFDLYFDVKAAEPITLEGYGRVPSLRIAPRAEFEGLFVHKGAMTLWVSTDARKICTQMKAQVPVASIRVLLAAVQGPGDDAWIKRAPTMEWSKDLPPENVQERTSAK